MKHSHRLLSVLTAAAAAISTLPCMFPASAETEQTEAAQPQVIMREPAPPMFIPWHAVNDYTPSEEAADLYPLADGGMYGGQVYSDGTGACLISPLRDCFALRIRRNIQAGKPIADSDTQKRVDALLEEYTERTGFNINGSLVIFQNAAAFTPDEIDAVRDRFCKAGLIDGFYYPGEVAYISGLRYDRTSLLTYALAEQVDTEAVQNWLDGTHPGCTVKTLEANPEDGFPEGNVPGYRIETEAELTFEEQFRIAVEIWQNFDIKPYEEYLHIFDPLKAVHINSLEQYGDLNLDGETDVTDAVMMAKFISGDSTLQICDTGLKNAMRYSRDNTLDADDLTLLLQFICKLVSICE
ncbi:MAG: hypothetical protein K5705_04540 [Oscillospiraceae bacterium]|nr:hypothetical protein [Oscillospiraceae bacterium]